MACIHVATGRRSKVFFFAVVCCIQVGLGVVIEVFGRLAACCLLTADCSLLTYSISQVEVCPMAGGAVA